MKLPVLYEYATEGAPLLIADLPAASQWRGREDDGSGVVVEYMGRGMEKLPAPWGVKKPALTAKKFKSLAEAQAFAEGALAALQRLHPEAKPPRPGLTQGY